MYGTMFRGRWIACAALLAGGCGAIPDIIVDTIKSSAKKAVQEAVEDVIDDAIGGTVEQLLDFSDFEFPSVSESEDEQDGALIEEADEDVDDRDQGTGRTGRTGRTAVNRRWHDSSQLESLRLALSVTHYTPVLETTQRAARGS